MGTPKSGSVWRAAFLATAIGIDLIVCMFVGYGLGKLLQRWISPSPLWLVLSIMCGFAVGIYGAYLMVRSELEDKA